MVLNFSAFQNETQKKIINPIDSNLDMLKKAYPGGDFSAKIEKPLDLSAFKPITKQDILQQQKDVEKVQGTGIRIPFAKEKTFEAPSYPAQRLVTTLVSRAPELLVSLPVAAVNFFRKNIKALVGSSMGQENVLDKPVMTQQFKTILGFDPKRFGISDVDLQDTWFSAFQELQNQETKNPSNGNTAKQYQNSLTAVAKTIVSDVLDVLFGYDVIAGTAKAGLGLTKLSFRQLPDSVLFKIQQQNVSPQAIKDALTGSSMASPVEKKIAEDFIKGLNNKERFELFQVARSYEIKGNVGGIPLTTGVEPTAIGKFAEAKLPKLPKLPPQQITLLNAGKLNLQAGKLDIGEISDDIKSLVEKANSVPELQKLLSIKQLAELEAKGIGIEALYNTIKSEEIQQLTPEQEVEYQKAVMQEMGTAQEFKKTYGKKLFRDIQGYGGLKEDTGLREEMSDIPKELFKEGGYTPDQIIAELNTAGYNFNNGEDLIDAIRSVKTTPEKFKQGETGIQRVSKMAEYYAKEARRADKLTAQKARQLEKEIRTLIKENTFGKNVPPKKVIEQTTGISQPPEGTVLRTQKQLLRKEEIISKKAGKSAVSQYKREQKFLENIQNEITTELNKPKGKQRSVIAFVKKLGEFNQTVINEIKDELGIDRPISQMNLSELQDFIGKLKERLRFKYEHGYEPSAETKATLKLKDTPKPELTEEDYIKNRGIKNKETIGKSLIKTGKRIQETTGKLLTPISTRLENIDPTLKYALRKFEFTAMNSIQKDKLSVVPYLKKIKVGMFKKMGKDDLADLDLALKNGDVKKINEINKKYGIEKEYEQVKKTLDDFYNRANEVGFDIGYKKDYFPRMIKDTEGFLEYFGKQDYWSILEEAIQRKEMELGRYLLPEEKANLINTMIRGYQGGQITLSGTGSMKKRIIDLVTPELNKFYYNSPAALLKYIESVDDKIAARKFFGKGNKVEGFNNVEDSVGAYTTDLLAKGKITAKQELELRQMLNARFNPKGTHGIVGLYKNLAYIDVMGSFLNAVTQLGDQAWAIYRAGILRTIKSDVKSVFGKSKITKESLGVEANSIAQEFSDAGKMAKAIDKIFTLTGLNKMDRLGKQALVNGAIEKYMKMAQNPKIDFLKKLEDIFGKESEQVLEDLKNGEITENVKLLAFNELLDFHPVALSEMPEQYLKGGNSRIFYMLKSYTLKQFDIFRREAFREMKKGNWLKGIKNLLYLTSLVILANGTADEIKDLLTNRKTKLSDRVIDQISMLAGFSRYNLGKISEIGLGSAILEQVTPPTNFIDNISKDLLNLYKDFDKSANINKLKSVQDIPLIGKFYYWWFGKGASDTKKYAPKQNSGLPELPKLPSLPPLPKLPALQTI